MQEENTHGFSDPHEFERLLDSRDAAFLMQIHPETLKRMARRGEIAALKFGKVWRFRRSDIEACIQRLIQDTQTQISQTMAPSDSAVCGVRNRRI